MDKLDLVLLIILVFITGLYIGVLINHSVEHPDFAGAYIQAARMCVHLGDFNSSWCKAAILQVP